MNEIRSRAGVHDDGDFNECKISDQEFDASRVKFQLLDSFLGKILQPAILTHSASKAARSIAFDLKKILPSSELQNSS